MNTHCLPLPAPVRPSPGGGSRAPAAARCRRRAFSLLEIIGVLAVMAILMLALVPSLMKDLTLKLHASEAASLTTLVNGLRSYVSDTRQIPGPATFAQNIAVELGWLVSDVSTNAHGNARLYLPDPALRIGPPPLTPFSTLPYVQGNLGSDLPVNPRVMLISSLGAPLSAAITAGAATNAAMFAQIWNSADGTAPVGWTGSEDWSSILIQRLNLAPLFVQLLLNNNSTTLGWYSIDNTNSPVQLPSSVPFSAFFLVGTGLGLHTTGGAPMQVQQVLQDFPPNISATNVAGAFLAQGNSFVYDNGIWRGKLFMSTTNGPVAGMDLQAACNIFLSGPRNVYKSGTLTQSNIAMDMWYYMSNYVYWATTATSAYPGGFDPKNRAPVVASQNTMNNDIGTYCNKKASSN